MVRCVCGAHLHRTRGWSLTVVLRIKLFTRCIIAQEAEIGGRWRWQRSWVCRQEEPSVGFPGPTGAVMRPVTRPSLLQRWRSSSCDLKSIHAYADSMIDQL